MIVDENTVFVSLICNRDDVPNVQPYPRSVMAWSGSLYSDVFNGIGEFQLRENGLFCRLLMMFFRFVCVFSSVGALKV